MCRLPVELSMGERDGFAEGKLNEQLSQQWKTLPADRLGPGTTSGASEPDDTVGALAKTASIKDTVLAALRAGAPVPDARCF
jgi:hypothetical protein